MTGAFALREPLAARRRLRTPPRRAARTHRMNLSAQRALRVHTTRISRRDRHFRWGQTPRRPTATVLLRIR